MSGHNRRFFFVWVFLLVGWLTLIGNGTLVALVAAQEEPPPPVPMAVDGPLLNAPTPNPAAPNAAIPNPGVSNPAVPNPAVPNASVSPAAAPNAEVLTRGPIHEAYAMPATDAPGKGLVVPKRPPNPIEERAPEVKPQGNNAIWIPGYWSWEDDRKDFIWISGVWRVAPPGQRWVPGYWQEGQDGWHWVSGYWMPGNKSEAVYMPQPPASVEHGPTSPTPGDANFWVPGHWQWRGDRYVWVPGYWAVARPNLVWVYPTYSWTPRGWVYCDGYWDYPL